MQERELTRLSCMVSAIVARPSMIKELTDIVLSDYCKITKKNKTYKESEDLVQAVRALRAAIIEHNAYDKMSLQKVGKQLSESPDQNIRFAGFALVAIVG